MIHTHAPRHNQRVADGNASRQRKAFTLIELLVVIAIISLLVSILLPSLTKAKELAKIAACASNEHSLGLAAFCYASENNDVFPYCDGNGLDNWSKTPNGYLDQFLLSGGIENKNLFYCPTSPRAQDIEGYWDNIYWRYLGYLYIANRDPTMCAGYWFDTERVLVRADDEGTSDRLLFTDLLLTDGSNQVNPALANHWVGNEPQGSNHLYGDGHVQWWPYERLEHHWLWGTASWNPVYHQIWND